MSDSGRTMSRPEDEPRVYRVRYMGPANNKAEGTDIMVEGTLHQVLYLFPQYGSNGRWVVERVGVLTIYGAEQWKARMGL